MRSQSASLAEHGCAPLSLGAVRVPSFHVCLSLGYYVNFTGAWRTGVTRRVSRGAVEFVTSDRAVSVGDYLQYVLVFPGSEGRTRAVALCRGRVVSAGATVVVTIDQQHLQAAAGARGARYDARKRWLTDLCEAARLGGSAAAAPAANPVSPARPAVQPRKHGRVTAPDRRLSVASPA
jgi:hypothetical protein